MISEKEVCKVDGCERDVRTAGMCCGHYDRLKKYGDPAAGRPIKSKNRPKQEQKCRIDGCDGKYKSGGWCHKHYERFKKYGDPLAGGVFKTKLSEKCSVDGCENKPVARCMCSTHYSLFMKYGDPNKAKFKWYQNKRDEWHVSKSTGYVWRYVGRDAPGASTATGYIYQHREVMREKLGRELLPGENVHHINGVKTDNRPENLELWVTSQPAGQRPEDLVAWAKEILLRYDK